MVSPGEWEYALVPSSFCTIACASKGFLLAIGMPARSGRFIQFARVVCEVRLQRHPDAHFRAEFPMAAGPASGIESHSFKVMTRPFAINPQRFTRREDAAPRLPPLESQALLRECFVLFEARPLDGARSSLEMSNDLFESNNQVGGKEVQEFLSKRGEWVARFPKTLGELFEGRHMAGCEGRRPDADLSPATLRAPMEFNQEKQTALAVRRRFSTALRGGNALRSTSGRRIVRRRTPCHYRQSILDRLHRNALGATSRNIYPNPRVWRPLLERLLSDLRPGIKNIYLTSTRYSPIVAPAGNQGRIAGTQRASAPRRSRSVWDLCQDAGQDVDGLGINVAVPDAVVEGDTRAPLVFAEFATPGRRPATRDAAPAPGTAAMSTDTAIEAADGTPSVMDAKTILTGLTALAEAVTRLEAMPSGAALSDPNVGADLPNLDPLMALGTSTPLFATLGHWQKLDLASAIADAVKVRTEGGIEGVVVPLNLIPHIRAAIAGHITNPADGVTMDVIALLFDYIFGDDSISETARDAFARLQVPIVKAALLDRTFFSDRRHPARLFSTILRTPPSARRTMRTTAPRSSRWRRT